MFRNRVRSISIGKFAIISQFLSRLTLLCRCLNIINFKYLLSPQWLIDLMPLQM